MLEACRAVLRKPGRVTHLAAHRRCRCHRGAALEHRVAQGWEYHGADIVPAAAYGLLFLLSGCVHPSQGGDEWFDAGQALP